MMFLFFTSGNRILMLFGFDLYIITAKIFNICMDSNLPGRSLELFQFLSIFGMPVQKIDKSLLRLIRTPTGFPDFQSR